jgi:hypothetical protein
MEGSGCEIYIDGSFNPRGSMTIYNYLYVNGDAVIDAAVNLYKDMAVGGDLRIQKPCNGAYIETEGYLTLHGGAYLSVFGDFYTQSTANQWFGYGTAQNPATLELYGDFHHIGANTYFTHVYENGFKFVLFGEGQQTVSFGNTAYTSLGTVSAWNDGGICFTEPVNSFAADFDLSITADYPINNLNGYVVVFTSDVVLGSVNLAGGVLVCEGDLTVNGSLNFNHGQVYAEGDVILNQYGSLNMSNSDDALIVYGELVVNSVYNVYLYNGYLDLKGDLTIDSAVSFWTSSSVNAQFSGDSPQIAAYQSGSAVWFGTLAFTDDDPGHVTASSGLNPVSTAGIYATYGTLYSLEEILTEVVKVEWEIVYNSAAMLPEVSGVGNSYGTLSNGNSVTVIITQLSHTA